ncbi:MAG TPA: hypothetical protein PLV08_14180 [Flavobacteriales bacterium]|nr:hypothetical protein [Flavobacteriales bacterium]HQY00921.1 hypothetical protein [Flavobacteriales bacterium]
MKHWAAAPGNDPVKRAVHAFVQRLNTLLKGRVELVKATDGLHDELFALRLRALQHLATTNDLDLMVALDQVAKGWKEKAQGQAMELMVWNMEFAVDVQRDLLRSLKSQGIALNTDTVATFAPLRDHRFTELVALVPALVPNPQAAEVLTTWLLASLRMELALLMADAVLNEEVAIGPKRLYALNSMLVRAAQDFGACASLMGLTRSTRPEPVFLAAEPVSAAYIKEQKELAELGIGDWFKAWA